MTNKFLAAVSQHDTYTENGAVSHSTTGDGLLDYFSKAGTYKDRAIGDVYRDISKCWAESPKITMQMIFYLRMVTRQTKGFLNSDAVQKGQGIRDEYRKAITWVAINHPEILYSNLWLMPLVGTWKDLWHETLLDVLDRDKVYELIQRGMNDKYNAALIAKFLPKIRSKSHVFNARHKKLNDFARGLCSRMGWTEKNYRQYKSAGEAHKFQKDMCNNRWTDLNFKAIPGKALFSLVNHKGKKDKKTTLERHNLEAKYLKWLDTQPVAKFTGYVYELLKAAQVHGLSLSQKHTLDKQFDGLIQLARKDRKGLTGNVWCALDTSGSMSSGLYEHNVTPLQVCVALGIYFSTLNQGAFQDSVIMFDNTSKVLKLKGTFTEKVAQVPHNAMGGTNFQSVVDEIVRVRRTHPEIPIEEYPETLLVVSDMQFNCTGSTKTNYEAMMSKLQAVGLPNIKCVWWWVTGRGKDFPSTGLDEGVTMIGGFDGAIITNILGGETTTVDKITGKIRQLNAYEQMLKALNQESLNAVSM